MSRETNPITRFLGTGLAATLILCAALVPLVALSLLVRLLLWALGVC